MVAQARDCVALMGTSMRHTPISRRVMEASQRLRVVAKYTVGVDDIDTDAATDLGIMVCHAPTESNCFGVAETTVSDDALAAEEAARPRRRRARRQMARRPTTSPTTSAPRVGRLPRPDHRLRRASAASATRVAQLLTPWRGRMIAYDPYVQPSQFLAHGVQPVDYETLLRESDLVSFHVVLTKETRYMFGEEQIKLMKPHAVVVNTSRGKVIDEKAVARAIEEGRLRGTAIDAFEEEPLPMESPLRKLGNRVAALARTPRPTPKAASCVRASTGRRARWSPRSKAASRTTSTTGRAAAAGSSASAGRRVLEPLSGQTGHLPKAIPVGPRASPKWPFARMRENHSGSAGHSE